MKREALAVKIMWSLAYLSCRVVGGYLDGKKAVQ